MDNLTSLMLFGTVACRECFGKGKLYVTLRGKVEHADCARCKGTGTVQMSVDRATIRAWLGLDAPKEA